MRFPFQMKLYEQFRITKQRHNNCFPQISFQKDIPSGGSQAGNMSQISCPRYIILILPNNSTNNITTTTTTTTTTNNNDTNNNNEPKLIIGT